MDFNTIDRKERTVYVTGIHPGCDESQIYDLFNKTGIVEKVVLHLTEEGNPHYCLVVYKDPESVMFTIAQLNGHRLMGQAMNLRPLRESSHAAVLQRAITRRRNAYSPLAGTMPPPLHGPPYYSSPYHHHPASSPPPNGGGYYSPGGFFPPNAPSPNPYHSGTPFGSPPGNNPAFPFNGPNCGRGTGPNSGWGGWAGGSSPSSSGNFSLGSNSGNFGNSGSFGASGSYGL